MTARRGWAVRQIATGERLSYVYRYRREALESLLRLQALGKLRGSSVPMEVYRTTRS